MSIGEQIRNPIWVRFADKDKEPVKEWLQANLERNAFDPKMLEYPSTKILAAHNNGKTYAYMPVQQTAMLESLGFNPESSPNEIAESILHLVQAAATLASGAGFGEIHFLASDPNTAKAAQLIGFEELPYKIFRRRL